jgi:hypothetical protein
VTDAPVAHAPDTAEFRPGLVCRGCGGVTWHVTRTRLGPACVRRWRTCAACDHEVRTAERIESDAHPEHDAA